MAIETFEHILGEHPFFQGLAEPYLATLVGCTTNVKFDAGEFIFHEGEPADRFYILRHGRVAIGTFAPPRGSVTIDTIDEGEVFGWSWLFPPFKCHFSAQAVTFVRSLALDGVCLRNKVDQDPVLGFQLLTRFARVVVQRLEATQLQLLDLYGNHS